MFADQLLKWKGKFVSEGQGCKGWEPFLASSESSMVSLELKKKMFSNAALPVSPTSLRLGRGQKFNPLEFLLLLSPAHKPSRIVTRLHRTTDLRP